MNFLKRLYLLLGLKKQNKFTGHPHYRLLD